MSAFDDARASLRKQLSWRGPSGLVQGIFTLTRDEAEALLAGPTEPAAVLGGMKPRHGTILCDCSSSDCNGGDHGYCGCERANRLTGMKREAQ